MKKVLATLLAVLLLTCVFATVAMADTAPEPNADPNNYNYGYSITMVSTAGKTIVKDGDHIKLDKSNMEKPSNSEIEKFLNDNYVAKPPKFTVRCVNPLHMHAMTDEGDLPFCEKGWVKESNSHYTCDGGYWEVVDSSVDGKSNVVKAQWCCPYQKDGKHKITVTITYKAPHTHVFDQEVKEDKYLKTAATCTKAAEYVKSCRCGEAGTETFTSGDSLGHIYGEEWQEDNNAFIDGKAAHVKYCTRANCDDHDGSALYEQCVEGSLSFINTDGQVDAEMHYMYCTVCGRCTYTQYHDFSNWTNTTYATCTEGGKQQRWCFDCNYREETDTNPQGHDPEVQFKQNPTCLNTGIETHYECSRCGQLWRDELMTEPVEAKDLVIPDLGGHLYADDDWVTDGLVNHKHYCQRFQKAPVCLSLSAVETYAWYDCGADTLEDTVQTEPHTWGEWYAVANMWNVEERQCTKCTEKQTRTVDCDHMWTEIKREPTCLDEGYQADKCIKCGLIAREQVLPALGHDWGEWEVVTPATTEAEGLEKRVCKRDASHVETRPIAKLEPTPAPTEEPTVEPTVEPTAEPTAQPTAEPTKKPGKTDIPKTGDNSHFGYAYLMIAVAAAGLVVLAATRRKEGSK